MPDFKKKKRVFVDILINVSNRKFYENPACEDPTDTWVQTD
jgi:hypothetical protein